jgi:hypothetical protein
MREAYFSEVNSKTAREDGRFPALEARGRENEGREILAAELDVEHAEI